VQNQCKSPRALLAHSEGLENTMSLFIVEAQPDFAAFLCRKYTKNIVNGCNPTTFLTHFLQKKANFTQKSALFFFIVLLLILILSLVLFRQFQKYSKRLHPLFFHFTRIHHLPIRLYPIQHIVLFYPMLRRIPMILFYETLHFIVV
jgi:hypothetical protein